MKIEAANLAEFRVKIQQAPVPDGKKDQAELVPLRALAYSDLFDELLVGEGPFMLEACPCGQSQPPDWVVASANRRVSIEVTQITTNRQEAANNEHGRTVFDTSDLLSDKPWDAAFKEQFGPNASHPEEYEDEAEEAGVDQVFYTLATDSIRRKYRDLSKYSAKYDFRVLLLWDKMWATPEFWRARCTFLGDWLKGAPSGGFDAIVMTDGNISGISTALLNNL